MKLTNEQRTAIIKALHQNEMLYDQTCITDYSDYDDMDLVSEYEIIGDTDAILTSRQKADYYSQTK